VAAFRFYTRGAGLAEAIADGFYCETYFTGLFRECPEPLLTEGQFGRLEQFLFMVPRLHAKRTKSQRAEAAELLSLISEATAGALVEEARELLCRRIAGERIRAAHRPKANKHLAGRDGQAILLAKWIKQSVEECLRKGWALEVPRWGSVQEDPVWLKLPRSERALQIACSAVRGRGYPLPSDPTLRNRMSQIPDLHHLIVKAREEKQG
jgi:hypothetical protein